MYSSPGAAWIRWSLKRLPCCPAWQSLPASCTFSHLADSGDYDTIIIDAAPTGSTLQLLSFPDIAPLVYREDYAL